MLRPSLDQLFDEVLSDRRLLAHPFYRRWEAGELERSELAAYAGQYRHFEQALPQVLETVVGKLPPGTARQAVQANLDDERAVPAPHLELFDAFARAVGAPAAEAASPEPATCALVGLYQELSGSEPLGALAALAAYEVQAPAIARSKAAGLRARYGIGEPGTRFWDVHGTMDDDHARWTLDALAALAEEPGVLRPGAEAAAEAWWAFLDERQEAAGVLAPC